MVAKHPNENERSSICTVPPFNIEFVKLCCSCTNSDIEKISAAKNDSQHTLFLTVCRTLEPNVNVYTVSNLHPDGGKIGIGNSYLNVLLKFSKILRVHSVFHDAFGLMSSTFKVGPGYCYGVSGGLGDFFAFGHVTGIIYWTMISVFNRNLFNRIIV